MIGPGAARWSALICGVWFVAAGQRASGFIMQVERIKRRSARRRRALLCALRMQLEAPGDSDDTLLAGSR